MREFADRSDHVEPIAVGKPVAVPEVQVVGGVIAVEVHHDRRAAFAERSGAQPDRVDRAEPGVGDQDDDIGGDEVTQRHRVAVGCQRRANAARRFDDPDRRPGWPVLLGGEAGAGEGLPAQSLGGHRRRHRGGIPAVRRAHVPWCLSAGGCEQLGVGRTAVPGEGLGRLARGDRNATLAQAVKQAAGDPRLAHVGGRAADDGQPLRPGQPRPGRSGAG
jgi:hypothetical protein